MEFPEPVGDRFAIPGKGEFEWIVNFGVVFVLVVARAGEGWAVLRFFEEGVEFHLALALGEGLFALDVGFCGIAFGGEEGCEGGDAVFTRGNGAVFEAGGGG